MERALDPHILVGMPHLNAYGLSETWLMKELGHRHWLMLARDMGMENADFRTMDGRAAYAAICATSLRNAHLELVSANDVLEIRSTLSAVSRTQISSHHRLSIGADEIAEVELLSTFVQRSTAGDNYSIARIAIACHPARAIVENALERSAAVVRADVRERGADLEARSLIGSASFRISPTQQFNGAGLFYFAEFQALMDRACEERASRNATWRQISNREVYFFGNIQANEIVRIETQSIPDQPTSFVHRLLREDGKIIAHARCS